MHGAFSEIELTKPEAFWWYTSQKYLTTYEINYLYNIFTFKYFQLAADR